MESAWTVDSNDTLDNLQLNATFFNESLSLWETVRAGELVLSGANQKGWLRLQRDDPAFGNGTVEDPSAGLTSGHYEFIFSVGNSVIITRLDDSEWSYTLHRTH